MIDDYMTIREAFLYMKCDEWHLRGLIKKGLLESVKVHRNNWPEPKRSGKPLEMMAVRKSDIDRYLST